MNATVKNAILSRQAALKSQSTVESALVVPPPAPIFPAQTLLPDLRIPIASLGVDLDYLIPKPALEHDADGIQPQIRIKGAATWTNVIDSDDPDYPYLMPGPVADRDWTVPYKIRRSLFREELTPETPTEWEFKYIYFAGGTNDTDSEITTFAIDTTPPYVVKTPPSNRIPGAPTWPADLGPTVPIDEAYLEGKTHIIVKPVIPANYQATDVYKFFFGPAPDSGRDTPVFDSVLTANEAAIPVQVFVAAADGPNQLIYTSRDLPGNQGRPSNFSQRNVQHAKDPDPGTVLPPIVTLANGADGDNLIDLADTQFDPSGVEFKVKVPTPNAAADTIVGYWGGQQAGLEQRVGTNTELTFHASYDLAKQVYGDTDGIVSTNVSFRMFRGIRQLADNDVDIDVDISYIGPDPITIGLDPPTLTTTAGSADEIKEGDYGDAAITAHIKLFATPPTEEGWVIDLFYDDIQIGATIPLTTGQENTTISRVIPWTLVNSQGSGSKVLRYALYIPGSRNPTESRPKTIPVEPFPIEMDAPVILGLAGPARRIGCSTLNFPTATVPNDGTTRRNLLVRVLPNTYTVDGEIITLKYQAYELNDPTKPIPDTDAVASYSITGPFPSSGAIIGIGDYAEDFKPAHLQSCRITYSISRTGSTPTPDSLPALNSLDLDDSVGAFCEEFVIPTP
jgi:hypothetical protein